MEGFYKSFYVKLLIYIKFIMDMVNEFITGLIWRNVEVIKAVRDESVNEE